MILSQMKWILRAAFRAVLIVSITTAASLTMRGEDKEKDPDQIGNRDVGKGLNLYSVEKEIAIGKQMAQQVEHQAKSVDDPVIAEYVNRVGQNLVRNSDATVPFTIKVIDDENINAFALPGGSCFVNAGIIMAADNEATTRTPLSISSKRFNRRRRRSPGQYRSYFLRTRRRTSVLQRRRRTSSDT